MYKLTREDLKEREVRRNLYDRYKAMMRRCNNPMSKDYKYYGLKGITVCNEWQDSFESFYKWCTDNRYEKVLQLDRTDNSKSYCPENCRFVTQTINLQNRDFIPGTRIGQRPRILKYNKLNKLPIGVTKNGTNYRARVTINGKLIHIGSFKTARSAKMAYTRYLKTVGA